MYKLTEAFSALLNTVVGAIRINTPQKQTQHYETACWYEKRETLTGVYPIKLVQDYHNKDRFYLSAEVPAVVTDDYFPSLFCGNVVSHKGPKHIGESRMVTLTFGLKTSILNTGTDLEEQVNIAVFRETWAAIIGQYEACLLQDYSELPAWWAKYQGGEDQFNSRVGMVGFMASRIEGSAKAIQEVKRHAEYHARDSYYVKNTAWTKGVQNLA